MNALWLRGLLSHRSWRLLGAIAGVTLTVALLVALGSFIASSSATMTQRAIAGVPVDWQVQLVPGTPPQSVVGALKKATPVTALDTAGYADISGFRATTGGTTQTTGAGKVLGLPAHYRQDFPGQIRALIGRSNGALVAQQTAANLHVRPGDTVTIRRKGAAPVKVQIDGVVSLPNADSMFQAVGVPAGAAPQAPPDNVLLMPSSRWHQLFDPQAAVRPDSVRLQLHANIAHAALPADPGKAYLDVQRKAKNLEARIAGSGVVADNLAARLGGARADALYARVLFLFLGLPGALLAALLTLAVSASGVARRRQEQALLRTRGAASAQILQLAGIEALTVGVGGVILGVGLACVAVRVLIGAPFIYSLNSLWWGVAAALLGLALALVAVLVPAWRCMRGRTVVAARDLVGRGRAPLWRRLYLDLILLAVSGVVFWQTASSGYQVVLAPEGVSKTAVHYQAFIAPLFLWLGIGLFSLRLWMIGLDRGRKVLAQGLQPIAHELSGTVAASIRRQRSRVTQAVVLIALALSFATATAVFNTTFNAQARVDAMLTNGADVTVTGTTAAPAGGKLAALRALPGVAAAQPMQHRFAYVGNDLQDMYGIRPKQIGQATQMSNAYFASGNARTTLAKLANHPDGVLVSAETVRDFRLQPGERINLRLQFGRDHQYHTVPFTFVGVVREFPTAPKDSFLVANASYIAQQTGVDAAEVVLLRSSGHVKRVAAGARRVIKPLPGAKVTDLGSTQTLISSSLTAVDLHGLTRLELGFAILLVVAATGLVWALGLADRRRSFAILSALGARRAQLGAFVWSEGVLILVSGAVVGFGAGFGVAAMLVKVLTGVFDPPPQSLAVPWLYLTALAVAALAAMLLAVIVTIRASAKPEVRALRDL